MAGFEEIKMNARDSAYGDYEVPNDEPQTEETDFGGTNYEVSRSGNEIRIAEEAPLNIYEEFDNRRPGRIAGRDTNTAHEYIEIDELGNNRVDDSNIPNIEETSFGGNTDSRDIEHNRLADLFRRVLDLPECDDTRFMNYLLDSEIISVTRDNSHPDGPTDYLVTYSGAEYRSEGGVMADDTLRDGIRKHYDEWSERLHREAVKRAGVIVGIGLSIAAIVTGLAVGLTRGGSDVIHAGKKRRKWEKLNPAKVSIPWSDIEEAGGDVLVFTGKYLTVILAVSAVYLTARR